MRLRRSRVRLRRAIRSLPLLSLVSLLLVAGALSFVPRLAAAAPSRTHAGSVVPGAIERSVPGSGAPKASSQANPDRAAVSAAKTVWPAAVDVTVGIPASGPASLSGLPVTVAAADGGVAAPGKLHAKSLGRDKVAKLGPGTAVALAVQRADDKTGNGAIRLTVDYSGFAQAFGGNYADRLRLVKLAGSCADQPDAEACGAGTAVPAENNTAKKTLTATVDVSDSQVVYAVTPALSGTSTGDYRSTDMNESQKWIGGSPSGDFTYSYPIELPPPPYGDAPDLALTYDSSSVDGRTSRSNNQVSWVGQGWDLDEPYIQRVYKPCADDGHPSWGDLCWSSPYSDDPAAAEYAISINGHTTELLKAADGSYRMRDDQSYKIEHLTGGPNDDNDGEYWVITTLDGTRDYFGYGEDLQRTTHAKTNSNWTVPVISDDAGEPCHQSDLASCHQTYRWNLDHIQDTNKNWSVFYYETETNDYERSSSGNDLWYIRGGYLSKIEYGKTETKDADPPAYVSFTHYNRCTERTTVDDPDLNPPPACPTIASSPSSYPDVPTDLICSSGCSKHSPSFFVTDWLDSITTYARNAAGTGYDPVTKYQLKHAFPSTDDGTSPELWLDAIRRIGYQGGTIREGVTSFDGTNYNNRVDYNKSVGVPPLSMRRLTSISNELGGETKVAYGHQSGNGCPTGGYGGPGWSTWYPTEDGHWDTNTDECFPQYFKPEGSDAGFGIFHKYMTLSVTETDHVGGQPDQMTSYKYLDGAAWHHDDDMLAADSTQSWGDWRGYGTVQLTEGAGPNTQRTLTTTRFFRGMDADAMISGTRSVALTDYDGGGPFKDSHFLAGEPLQEQSYRLNDDGSLTELASQRWVYWDSGITANGPGLHNAHMVRELKHRHRVLRDDGTWRVDEVDHTYDPYGLEATESELGDTGFTTDDTCTTTTYARNTDAPRYLIDYPETEETHQGSCTGPVISRTVTLYDKATSTDDTINKPTSGNPTEVHSAVDANTDSVVKHSYDGQGRELSETDPTGNTTTTSYSPAIGYPTNGVTVTNPLGQQTVTWTSRAFGDTTKVQDVNGRITESDYDALGRLVAVWLPTEPRSGGTPSYKFTYTTPVTGTAAPTGPTLVTSQQLQSGAGSGAVWLSSYEYLDGFGDTVETQEPSPQSGGRTVTVTRYDSRGLTALVSQPMYNSAAAGSGLLNPAESAIPQYTVTTYDALERETQQATKSAAAELWHTATTYHGSFTTITPPNGGQVVTWFDVFGQTTKVQNYLNATAHQDTTYTYFPDHELATITDPNGNVTSYTYDMLGQQLTGTDPDSGKTTTGYDLAGRVASTTDAKGQKISTAYDRLGRVSSRWLGDINTGTKLAENTYDTTPLPDNTPAKGELSSSTSYTGGQPYTVAVTGYDDRYRVTGRRWTIPTAQGGLAGSYQYNYGYDAADHETSVTYPAAGGLPAETVTEKYTNLGLPNTLTGAANYLTATTFSGALRLAARDYGTNVERQYGYEATTNRLNSIKTLLNPTATSPTTLQDDTYTYDPTGNVRSITDHTVNQNQCFGYDGRQRLTTAYTNATDCGKPADAGGPLPYNLGYSYDGAGNITQSTSNGTTTTYTYPGQGANSVRPHAVSSVGDNSYSYDADGNMASRTVAGTTSTLTWDPENQLASMTTATGATSFVYDPDGNRLIRRDAGKATLFLDGTEITTTTGSASPTATRYYVADGATVAERTPTGLIWLTADQQGSEQLAIDPSGNVNRQRYLPFGALRGTVSQLPTDRGFLGKVQDDTSGLDLLGARYYDPTIAKFITPDPEDNNDDPDTANPYAYADDNPTTFSDPTGLKPAECTGKCASNWEKEQKKRARTYHHGRYHYHAPARHHSRHHATHHATHHTTHHYAQRNAGCNSKIAGDCGNTWAYKVTFPKGCNSKIYGDCDFGRPASDPAPPHHHKNLFDRFKSGVAHHRTLLRRVGIALIVTGVAVAAMSGIGLAGLGAILAVLGAPGELTFASVMIGLMIGGGVLAGDGAVLAVES